MSCQKSVTTSIAIRRTYHFQTHTNCQESFSRRLYARCAEFRGAQYLNGSPACAFSGNSSPSRRGWLAAGDATSAAESTALVAFRCFECSLCSSMTIIFDLRALLSEVRDLLLYP
jgi:hypothetical protein